MCSNYLPYLGSGYDDNLATRYQTQSQLLNSNSRGQFDGTGFTSNDQHIGNSHQLRSIRYDNRVGLALGPPQPSLSSFQPIGTTVQQPSLNPFEDCSHSRDNGVDDFMSEEEIRIRSHEMLENEDMQHLLRLFSMNGGHGVNVPDDGFTFPSYMPSPSPNFSFDEDRTRPGKAVVGWLKIKAAMRWGFFVRKKAAEKRAQIVELEDE